MITFFVVLTLFSGVYALAYMKGHQDGQQKIIDQLQDPGPVPGHIVQEEGRLI